MAKSIESHIRDSDIAVRLGGDEFAVVFRDTDDEDLVVQRLEKIISEIKGLDEIDGYAVDVGASAGLAGCPCEHDDVKFLVEEADKALYQAKKKGKGQVCIHES